jgi:small subunit ribosomal protein S16
MLKIRLRRMGKRHSPFYRVVVSDSRRTPTASAVDEVGHYDPQRTPAWVAIDLERLRYWQEQGAQLSPTVARLVQQSASAPAQEPDEPTAKKGASRAVQAAAPEVAAPAAAPAEAAATPAAEAPADEAPAADATGGETTEG